MLAYGLKSEGEEHGSDKVLLDYTVDSDCTEGFGIGTDNKGLILRICLQSERKIICSICQVLETVNVMKSWTSPHWLLLNILSLSQLLTYKI